VATASVLWHALKLQAAEPGVTILPTDGNVVAGEASIMSDAGSMKVLQSTDRVAIDWGTFSIGKDAKVRFEQPDAGSIALNRVLSSNPSQIYGTLTSNGQVFLINPSGVLFGKGSSVSVGGLVSTTMSIDTDEFMAGRYHFKRNGSTAGVVNEGTITAGDSGLVAFLATEVRNEGTIAAKFGTVAFAGGESVMLSLEGKDLYSIAVDASAVATRIQNHGIVHADGGRVVMRASTADVLLGSVINTDGIVTANSIGERNGTIMLLGNQTSGTITIGGKIDAGGSGVADNGGTIMVSGGFVGLGGEISADGANGGNIAVSSGSTLSLAENVHARGLSGDGGTVSYWAGTRIFETSSSTTDAGGAINGGTVTAESGGRIASSGAYRAAGATGAGGRIDITAPDLRLLSARIDASGGAQGGLVRIGGPFQGGKAPSGMAYDNGFTGRWGTLPYIASASQTFINDGSSIDVSSSHGAGGTAVVWSNAQTTFLGLIDARGTTSGGFVEISSGTTLRRATLQGVNTGGGTLLLDPKDITIGEPSTVQSWNYAGILGAFATGGTTVGSPSKNVNLPLDTSSGSMDAFGFSVALNGTGDLLAVGAYTDDGFGDTMTDAGAVYLFSFAATGFTGGSLQSIIGSGYTGGKNVPVALDAGDRFGLAVSLNGAGDRLAAGADRDDGYNNSVTDSGAVYLFSFTDTGFTGGTLDGVIGSGYDVHGARNVSLPLGGADAFGYSLSLSKAGDRLVVGAAGDDGYLDSVSNSGAVYMFTFTDTGFSGGSLAGIIGAGYSGNKNVSVALDVDDQFGRSLSLNGAGDRLAIGYAQDDGYGNSAIDSGAVCLYTFTDTNFSGGSLAATIGYGYTGGKNVGVVLNISDQFGMSVSLNAAGDRLAVGATLDDGFNNSATDPGSVHLFTFTDTSFTGGTLAATIGRGYSGGKNISAALDGSDRFGSSVSLNSAGDLLAVGAYADDGFNNSVTDSGAVYLYTFSDGSFTGGMLAGIIGAGYTSSSSGNISLALDAGSVMNDQFGISASLNDAGDRLAVGAYGDDGFGKKLTDSGAVYLFSFTDSSFTGGLLEATIGYGYTGGKNVSVLLDVNDMFGRSVSLNGSGDRLAVGAVGDDGFANSTAESGAVYLFSFGDTSFTGGTLAGMIGRGYTDRNNVDVALDSSDQFGISVSLNDAGDRLAVGAHWDDGNNNMSSNSGAVYLYTFSDTSFTGGTLAGTIGIGYTDGKNVTMSYNESDYFGSSVSLNAAGDRLAVGSLGFDFDGQYTMGAVYLFTFTDTNFSGGTLATSIGRGRNLALPFEYGDQSGISVSLNGAGDRLAMGAFLDDGVNNSLTDSGAVYLFSFIDTSFTGGLLVSTIGYGYNGGRNISIPLGTSDYFGVSVSLNGAGDRLVVGARGDDGFGNCVTDSGALHLITFTDRNFTGGVLSGTIGAGYTPASSGNIALPSDLASATNDQFGNAVSLNRAGDRLAVGSPQDDGFGNSVTDSGAVYLFTFTDTSFTGGTLQGIIGSGYTGANNVSIALDLNDRFGQSVSLNEAGDRLAVGAQNDDGTGNSVTDSGAVYLFTFTDTIFTGGTVAGIIGSGYQGGKNVNAALGSADQFGTAVSLNAAGDRLAVGARGDDGATNSLGDSGAVYLYTFSDTGFTGGALAGIIGSGYFNTQELNRSVNQSLDANDWFGVSLSLNAAGDRLAVGAHGDDGVLNTTGTAGAVYLYTFSDTSFSSGQLAGIIGYGYTGGKNVSAPIAGSDLFGLSVSLNSLGDRLAAGAVWDDGATNAMTDSGAVYLFSFSDTSFSAGMLAGTIGSGYMAGHSMSVSLGISDWFGNSVSLNGAGDRLAVGAPQDDGLVNSVTDSGAVYLFTFTDSGFSGASLAGTIGAGYTPGSSSNIDLPLAAASVMNDQLGSSVSLNAAGDRLAVGAQGDDGFGNSVTDSGAVYLFTFIDTGFTGGTLQGIIGSGYVGEKNINVSLDASDWFGRAVSLNAAGDRLVVGAPQDDGFGNGVIDSGAVYLFSFSDTRFSDGTLEGVIGSGYTYSSGVNRNVALPLATGDLFGISVSLNADGDRLAVGAQSDDGVTNGVSASGAVYLFTFSDTGFTGGSLAGTIGSGYTYSGGVNRNVALTLEANDWFGISVSLNGAGDRLAAGAHGDDGSSNSTVNAGAVYLFTFSDTSFTGGALAGIIGSGYTPAAGVNRNINRELDATDYFGLSVSLNAAGDRLAVGAPGDDGNGNGAGGSGAVFLYSFTDTNFTGGALVSAIGSGYTAGRNVGVSLGTSDQSGSSLSLNAAGDRLAVGAFLDDGFNDSLTDMGAVYLFTFSDTAFTGGALAGVIGAGYSSASSGNIALPLDAALVSSSDLFGSSVSLNAAGDRLAVGAYGDDGYGNILADSGSVYLFSFIDSSFSGGSLRSIIGSGYTGGKNIGLSLDAGDLFGSSVSLNGAGDRLAVGAFYDDGFSNSIVNAGAVYLFTFSDTSFTGGTLAGTIGSGYTNAAGVNRNVNLGLGATDCFGISVSLNAAGDRLAVGAYGDDGATNALMDSGAVYLFSFSDTNFTGGALTGTIGSGYTYSAGVNKNVNQSLEGADQFGYSVSLNAAGDRLAVGAIVDDGSANGMSNSGAVYLYTFSDTSFTGGALAGIIGSGYTYTAGVNKNVNQTLDVSDWFGSSVSLNGAGDRLAVGALLDDGYGNLLGSSGAVYLYRFTDTSFSGGVLAGTIGQGYTGGSNVGIVLGGSDQFGRAVSLNAAGDRLAVGANLDDGSNNILTDSGAVLLFTFTDTAFSGGSLAGMIGAQYVPSSLSNVNSPNAANDWLGVSVSLNAAGDRLAVGASRDDGITNSLADSGAVYLFTFKDFTGGELQGVIGSGYTGGKNVNRLLDASDWFGYSVSLNASGDRLAVGAPQDGGFGNSALSSGAVYLYTFSDTSFTGGTLAGTIGSGYTSTAGVNRNVPLSQLAATDGFGWSVSLNGAGDRLAVGAVYDDAAPNNVLNSGAVYLFTFSDTSFTGGTLAGIIGSGYAFTAGVNRNVPLSQLAATDGFGSSVTLNAAGDRLAVGAYGDDGFANNALNSGAVYLFSFSDTSFTGGTLAGTIGYGYTFTAGVNRNVAQALDAADNFGTAVSLNAVGDRLAVGAFLDDGYGNGLLNSGAVYLYTFTDTSFTGGTLAGRIGYGYVDGKSLDVVLDATDQFGSSVSLNGAGDRLVVGAYGDDGNGGNVADSGALYLFSFADTGFSTGRLVGTLGYGYTSGVANQSVSNLPAGNGTRADNAGVSVSLNGAGDRLAVGAYGDDGYGNSVSDSGAVYLFSFSDTSFSGGVLKGIIGSGYRGGRNYDLVLDASDGFGFSVALNGSGDRLAVGAYGDDGYGNSVSDSGSVYLFSFADTTFTTGTLVSTIGYGYTGVGNQSVALNAGDQFGVAVSLNGAGDRLAVGAIGDDGYANGVTNSGAVYLFSFSDTVFTGGTLSGTIGSGYIYTAGLNRNVNIALAASDYFGTSVSLNGAGDRLAVGASSDDGFNNALTDSGAVYLFTFSDTAFNNGSLAGTIGSGYTAGANKNVAQSLETNDYFGYSVSLNGAGDRLAVGAIGDDGYGNTAGNAGAVYLYTFTDTSFTGGVLAGIMGHGYIGGKNSNVVLDSNDYFGRSVSLNGAGDRLAVGAPQDSGYGNTAVNSGAVYLFSFSDTSFSAGTMKGTLGYGYMGGAANQSLSNLLTSDGARPDNLGISVALNASGDRLAVGVYGDDGQGNGKTDSGAVYLYTFTDTNFSGGALQGIIGSGYTGTKNVNVALDAGDAFGWSVSLNSAGDRLAVGAYGDDGYGNRLADSGAVYLFSFADTSFTTATLAGTIGHGYSGGKDVAVALNPVDWFGCSVSLNGVGDRLAVSALYDDGYANGSTNSGAVYLFSFSDTAFTEGTLSGTIGSGYTYTAGVNRNINVGLGASDYFGISVSLNAAGNRLAVGAQGDDGATNALTDSGAVYLFSFSDTSFSGGTLSGTIGSGYTYTAGVNKNVSQTLESNDWFGYSVSFNANGDRLAVGASGDDGSGNSVLGSGAVYLYTFSDSSFTGGALAGVIGSGYTTGVGNNINVPLDATDNFGSSVSLNGAGDRLAVGAFQDDGYGNTALNSGSLYLFSFGNSSFSAGTLKGIMGNGYSNWSSNQSVANLLAGGGTRNDSIGVSVSLNDAGDRLAVGAYGDDGQGNTLIDSGAVYLYSFTDTSFYGGVLQAIIGSGYTGSKNLSVALDAGDGFGWSVSLNGSGDRLAVGALYDDGFNNTLVDSGAVYLFSFGDTGFSTGSLAATIGSGYIGGKNVSVVLDANDGLGSSVSLNGAADRLAVGIKGDDGATNALSNAGAVALFTFTDTVFTGGALAGTIGSGYIYTAGVNRNVNVTLGATDQFGSSLALNGSGDRLAVGSPYDDGSTNAIVDSGAVYLFTFTDTSFTGGSLSGTIGSGYIYTAGTNKNVNQTLETSDLFGYSVSLNGAGDRLAVGAYGDDGFGNSVLGSGAVYLYTFSDSSFTGGALAGTIGSGYLTGVGSNINVPLDASDQFGSSVSLNGAGDRLAVGALQDDGYGNTLLNSGSVCLFSFGNSSFSAGSQKGTLGYGYSTLSSNMTVTNLLAGGGLRGDNVGISVSLNGAGDRLAIGAWGDDGQDNSLIDSGAVYLYSFSDTNFSGGALQGIIGSGYMGAKNRNVALDAGDGFGWSVSLNGSGDRLAVGALYDDGYNNILVDSGAVYLFSFADTSFSTGSLAATIGSGYIDGKNISIALDASDWFGISVSLNGAGDRLAVGIQGDDGATNALSNAGAVALFTFTDTSFTGGTIAGTLGSGYVYTPGVNRNVNVTLGATDYFGTSVSLNAAGDRLAAGSPYDDGVSNGQNESGALYLFTFTDTNFTGGALAGTIGSGYTGGKKFSVALDPGDLFGYSVSLNDTGDRLAVGAYATDGFGKAYTNSGAVYLFTFTDTSFTGCSLAGTIGYGYVGGKSMSVVLDADDYFGRSVSLNGTGDRLAVGSPQDSGFGNSVPGSGGIYLFSFADSSFTGGTLRGILGYGYSDGAANQSVSNLMAGTGTRADNAGISLSLNGAANRLAIGAWGDDGQGNSLIDSGAVYLYSFTDTNFSGGALQGIIGSGYTGAKNVNVTLDAGDGFGWSVSLNSAGDRLAVGAPNDDGQGNGLNDSGAVYLFTFSDTNFTNGSLDATIGNGYAGLKNVNVALNKNDWFGSSVSLNAAGDRLAVGAYYDDGFGNGLVDSGAVYLFSFADASFSGGALAGAIGNGYINTAGVNRNVSQSLGANDWFGASVSLNAAGDRLAVGAFGDDGSGNTLGDSGAVYLYTFTDTNFSGGSLAGTIGNGYIYSAGVNRNVSQSLGASDWFGISVSLNAAGDRLAVGATGDDASGNSVSGSGAVYLYSFSDASFAGGGLMSTIGYGYTGGRNVDIPIEADGFGRSVSLNGAGDRLAVGATGDDGFGNAQADVGAVCLFTFNDSSFTGGELAGVIGRNHNQPMISTSVDATLDANDMFGHSVSLNGAGDRLAVGVFGGDGAGNMLGDSGAVYLYSFTDTGFSGGSLQGIMGSGYTGGKNVNVALDPDDRFGWSVSLNDAGDRIAVSTPNDDGFGNGLLNSGAVYLYSFTDSSFTGGTLQGIIGAGYTGGNNVNVALDAGDQFGWSVSLNGAGDRIAVGAIGDDGSSNILIDSGAVYLYSFTAGSFSGGVLESNIGHGYTGGKNIDMALDAGDQLGRAVSLNGAGDRLAVGAYGDDGYGNNLTNAGAVNLFAFSDSSFTGGTLQGVMGFGYSGGRNVNVELNAGDQFGGSVSLAGAGDRLAVGATGDDGAGNSLMDSGAAYLFSFAGNSFTGAALEGIIGAGYTGGKNLALLLDANDQFGQSLSLNASGDRLALGSRNDCGFDNSLSNSGAVYLYGFTDTNFSGGVLQGIMGAGYTRTNRNVSISSLGASDYFGVSVSLNAAGDRLAVGASRDDGFDNTMTDSGAVYLFSFADVNFTGGTLQGIMGSGYTGSKNVHVALDVDDNFGWSVSLNGAGDRLAVGAAYDDGAASDVPDSGAVYLFSFSDTHFSDCKLEGVIGSGYTYSAGVNKNVNVALDASDKFGSSVSLNAAGDRLAAGAYQDDGNGNMLTDSGAVYLFSFTGTNFIGGELQAVIGSGYAGGKNVNVPLDASDRFGLSVSLNAAGDRLAAGAYLDDGDGNMLTDSGAIHLFSFADTSFSAGALQATIGSGYTGTKSVNVALDVSDCFGVSVSLNGAGDRLAVGASFADGLGNLSDGSGAVYLYSFTDAIYSDAALQEIIGSGYEGLRGVNVALDTNDHFGSAVSLNDAGNRLAVGAQFDSGSGNSITNAGAVHLFAEEVSPEQPYYGMAARAFSAWGDQSVTLRASDIVAQLAAGTNLVLQANNDITLNTAIIVGGSSGGSLTFQAGRSILLNAGITTANGNLTLIANDRLSNGVLDQYRDAGPAVITMAEGTSIDAGTGSVRIELGDGAGKTFKDSGDITLRDVTAGSIMAVNYGPTDFSGIVLASGRLTATGADTSIELAGKRFINQAGNEALSTPNGRWLVWSGSPLDDTRGGVSYSFKQYDAVYSVSDVLGSGSGFLYSLAPKVTISLRGVVTKSFDGTNLAMLSPENYSDPSGLVDGDFVAFSTPLTGWYDTPDVGTGKRVSASPELLSGSNGPIAVYGYHMEAGAYGNIGSISMPKQDGFGNGSISSYDSEMLYLCNPELRTGSGGSRGSMLRLMMLDCEDLRNEELRLKYAPITAEDNVLTRQKRQKAS
jgi:filamentous hemagglutinin family protein